MKQFTISNQLTAMPKRLAMVLTVLFTVGVGSMYSETVTVTFSDLYNANTTVDGTDISVVDGITLTFNRRSGGTATQYYTSGSAMRWYGGGTLDVASTIGNITAITITYTQTANSVSSNVGTYTLSNQTGSWTGDATAIKFTQSGNSGHCRISKIEVTYTSSGGGSTGGDSGDDSGDDSDDCTWELVTDASTLKDGDRVVIAAKGYNYAISTTQNKNNRGQAAVTKDGSNITFGNEVQIFTLLNGKNSGTFAFQDNDGTNNGYLYAASSSDNYLRTESTLSANSSWGITIASDGTATIVAQGTNSRNTMQYNSSSSIFACYGSASQKALAIYKEVCTGGTTETYSVTAGTVQNGSIKFSKTDEGEFTDSQLTGLK